MIDLLLAKCVSLGSLFAVARQAIRILPVQGERFGRGEPRKARRALEDSLDLRFFRR